VSWSLTGLDSRDAARGRGNPPFCISAVVSAFLIGGCAIEQSDTCRQYIACQQEYDEAAQTGPTEFADYETDGVCWDSAENASTCSDRCSEALDALQEAAANANIDAPSCEA
jgi:hypothetical protein